MLRYAITDRCQYGNEEEIREAGLLDQAARLAADGVEFLQLREKDLDARDLVHLARGMLRSIHDRGAGTRLLINSRADIALAAGADGVHLTAAEDELSPRQVRELFAMGGLPAPVVSVSCHTLAEIERARKNEADLILFGPVFGKSIGGEVVVPETGIDALKAACELAGDVPVLALGGVTLANVAACVDAGAKGIAAIRLFR